MADTKITDLGATTAASLAAGDLFVVVDVSDTSMGAGGTDKKIPKSEIDTLYQPVDADLTAIAALAASNDDIVQRKAGVWTNRTIAQLLADLGLGSLYQPLDSDLTAIAALTTTSFGRAFLALADAAAGRTALGLGTAATTATTAYDAAGLAAAAQAASQPLDSDLTAIAALTTTSFGRALLTLADQAALTAALAAATTSLPGIVELATTAETITGTDTQRANTPAGGAAAYQALAQPVNAQTGTTYTLVAGDVGKLVTLSNASAIALTVPQDSDATIAIGTYVDLLQLGAGQVTVSAGTGATLRTSGLTAKARAQYSRLGVQKISANTWSLFGDLAAS